MRWMRSGGIKRNPEFSPGGNVSSSYVGRDDSARHIISCLFVGGSPRGRACAAGAPISSRRNGGKEGPGGFAHPGPPSTGAHGGGGLYGRGKDQPRIAARSLGTYVTGAAAPRAARIGITLQTLWVAALYRPGPPGRRRCHAAEIPGQSPQPSDRWRRLSALSPAW
mgnify:CR=1 FL=1